METGSTFQLPRGSRPADTYVDTYSLTWLTLTFPYPGRGIHQHRAAHVYRGMCFVKGQEALCVHTEGEYTGAVAVGESINTHYTRV
jgi:hypothetical protein